ncbi:MAG: 50S ribosomal protein L17 [Spirochaetales bacterium]|nr:50S ribosomal protein L17 [Spirochaetales bacterium]
MKHRLGGNKLSRKTSHRKAMTRNMVTSLFRYERITTTKAKALEIRRTAEKMITRAKIDSVHNRRIINRDIKDAEILNKLFTELGPVNKDRPGGYTRVLKTGLRKGDAAEMVILELVFDAKEEPKKKAAKPKKKAEKTEKAPEVKKEKAVKAEVSEEAVPTENAKDAAPAEEKEKEKTADSEEVKATEESAE